MPIHSLAVFCGSKSGNDPVYSKHAEELGKLPALQQITLIYGGGGKGIMQSLADNVMAEGGRVVGVIPKHLLEWEHQHKNISGLIVTRFPEEYKYSSAYLYKTGIDNLPAGRLGVSFVRFVGRPVTKQRLIPKMAC